MKGNKLISALYVTGVYLTGIYYGYKIGKTKGETEAYMDCAEQLNGVLSKSGYAAEVVINGKEES